MQTVTPDVTVIVPTVGRPSLARALCSVYEASRGLRIEVILVDDRQASAQASLPLLASLRLPRAHNVTLSVLAGEGRGPAAARNLAFECARGHYIALLDDDDLYCRHHLHSVLATARVTGARATHSGVMLRLSDSAASRVWPGFGWSNAATQLPVSNVFPPVAVLLRRDGLVQRFDESLRVHEDWALWLELLRAGERFAYTDRATALYSKRESQPDLAGVGSKAWHDLNFVARSYDRLCDSFGDLGAGAESDRLWMRRRYEDWLVELSAGRALPSDHYEQALAQRFGPPHYRAR